MKRSLYILLLAALLPLSMVQAKEYKVSDVPMVHLMDRTRYVSNPDNILSLEAVAVMDSMLYALEEKTGIQAIVVALTGIEGGDCFDFAYRLGKENGVGEKGRDNGLVILLSTDERCVQFSTGYGLEGVMPDAICKRIQQKYMVEHLANDDWNSGMVEGVRAVCGVLDGSMENLGEDDEDEIVALVIFLSLIFGGIGIISLAVWYSTRCPKCGKHEVVRVSSRIVQRCVGYVVRENTYRCSNCGYTFTRKEHADDNSRHSFGGGAAIGRGFGGGSFGGGFRGGSFGGGSFGGGGAGSRF